MWLHHSEFLCVIHLLIFKGQVQEKSSSIPNIKYLRAE